MKRFFFIHLIISCLPILLYGQEQIEYNINGIIDKTLMYDGTKVFLKPIWIDSTKTENIDSTIIKNGKFEMKGFCNKSPHLYFIRMTNNTGNFMTLEPGIIKVKIDSTKTINITGTSINDDLHKYVTKPWQEVQAQLKNENEKSNKINTINKYKTSILKFVEKYAEYPIVELFVAQLDDYRVELPSQIIKRLSEESKARLEWRKNKKNALINQYKKQKSILN